MQLIYLTIIELKFLTCSWGDAFVVEIYPVDVTVAYTGASGIAANASRHGRKALVVHNARLKDLPLFHPMRKFAQIYKQTPLIFVNTSISMYTQVKKAGYIYGEYEVWN